MHPLHPLLGSGEFRMEEGSDLQEPNRTVAY